MSQARDGSYLPPDVVVVGEALIDIVRTPDGDVEYPGGSPANVAYGLGRLNVPVGLLTAIGRDRLGAILDRHLESAGVELLPQSDLLASTATAVATLSDDGSATYDFNLCWDLPHAPVAAPPKLLHTGSLATFLEPGASAVRTLLQQHQGRSTITYDPNIRPSLLGSHAESLRIFEDLVPMTDVVKLSSEDAAWLYPHLSGEDTIQQLLSLGTSLVVLTNGSHGSSLATVVANCTIPGIKTRIADTIGAGDSYMAAMIAALLDVNNTDFTPAALQRIGSVAATAASLTVGKAGANPPTHDELDIALAERDQVPA